MGASYSRNAMLDSMRATIATEAKPADSGKESADSAITAGDETSENTETPTGGSEGGDESADDNGSDGSGSDESESGDGTAEGEEGSSTEEQASEDEEAEGDKSEEDDSEETKPKADASGKWEAEEQKSLETWGLKDAKATPEMKKLLKIARDNHKAEQEQRQQVVQSNDYLAAVGNALVNHDVENLNAMIEELGGEKLPFDLRTEEKQIAELTEGFNEFYDALEKGLSKEDFAKAQTALNGVYTKTNNAISKLNQKILARQAGDEAVKKLGVTPVKGKYLDGLKAKADQNFSVLFKEDAKAKAYMDILQPFFKKGTILQNPSKAYAMAHQDVNELGKALYFMKNFEKEFMPELKKQWEAAAKLKRIGKPPPSGKKGDSQETPAKKTPGANSKFNNYAADRLMRRVGMKRQGA